MRGVTWEAAVDYEGEAAAAERALEGMAGVAGPWASGSD